MRFSGACLAAERQAHDGGWLALRHARDAGRAPIGRASMPWPARWPMIFEQRPKTVIA